MNNISHQQAQMLLPLGEIYGGVRQITNIFYWFITLILLGLTAGIVIVSETDNYFAAMLMFAGALPVLATYYLVHRQKFEFSAVFLSVVLILLNTMLAS
ncbi:MAG: hypothetical protein HYZ24_12685, partial [Chloroflexi bacterium]|nr:hypothetical protein [Chloroflexota bacterium]